MTEADLIAAAKAFEDERGPEQLVELMMSILLDCERRNGDLENLVIHEEHDSGSLH